MAAFIEMKRISRLKVEVGGDGCWVADGFLAGLSGKVAAEIGAVGMECQADPEKKYAAEVSARPVKLVGTVKVKGFRRRLRVT